MDSEQKQCLGLGFLGFGTVGGGAVKIMQDSVPSLSEKTGFDFEVRRVAVRNLGSARMVELPREVYTVDPLKVVRDPQVDIVVEVMGGIEPARTLVLEALKLGKPVVTANKALLAEHGRELFEAALAYRSSIGFEASVCGGIPVIGAIRDGLVANRIERIQGILNGTTNYILMRMVEENADYGLALKEAQEKGYAEADPTLDVNGTDAAHKLVLLSNLGFHSIFNLQEVRIEGIEHLQLEDIRYADEMGYTIKLLAIARLSREVHTEYNGAGQGIELRVHPTLIPESHPLANVRGVNNAVLIDGDATGQVMLYGRGAGALPTGSAIVADILDAARGSARKTFTKLQFFQNPRADLPVLPQAKIRTRYYLRLMVKDQPGVMGKLANALGEREISIASLIQKEEHRSGYAPIVILTHQTEEGRFLDALSALSALPFIAHDPVFYRVEN